uniref:HAUS augmin-like complex, subunit 5 n=1 Tax=Myripristis murdjan TaxID=586833 RepID=A0A667X179_9TELE
MAEGNLVRELKRWATEEFNLPPQSLPNDNYLKTMCVGAGKSIWKYVIQHVFQERLLKQAEGQSEAAKRRELQEKIEQLRAEISHLDSQISGTEEQLATEEQSISRTWAQVEESQHRELLLQAFRQRCIMDRKVLSDDTCKISGHCEALEQLAKKAEIEVLFENKPSSSSDTDCLGSKVAAEPQKLHLFSEYCQLFFFFFNSPLLLSLCLCLSLSLSMTHEQRTAVFQYWLSAVEDMLGSYPPNQVLSALQHLASRQQRELEEKLASLDVAQDMTALRLRYENNHLLDVSREDNDELPPVKHLLQSAWLEVEQTFIELAQTRCRVQQLRNQLQAHKNEADLCMQIVFSYTLGISLRSVFELELQCVMQVAARDYIREQCLQLDRQARSRQEALRKLHSQWQSILDFRQLVDRQEQIRGLIKGNSMAKMELISMHRELEEFVQGKLVPQFGEVIAAANNLRNSVSQEARQFGTVSLLALDRRTVEGMQRIPASWLSIYRLQSSSFHSLCQSMAFPLYRAPEELCSQACSQHLELRFLCQLLKLHSTTLQKLQKQAESLHAPDQKALLLRVVEEDQKLLKSLVPRARDLTQHCSQGLSYGSQVKSTISFWWDQPAQHVLPEISKGGLTLQQWLQRWKLAAKASY